MSSQRINLSQYSGWLLDLDGTLVDCGGVAFHHWLARTAVEQFFGVSPTTRINIAELFRQHRYEDFLGRCFTDTRNSLMAGGDRALSRVIYADFERTVQSLLNGVRTGTTTSNPPVTIAPGAMRLYQALRNKPGCIFTAATKSVAKCFLRIVALQSEYRVLASEDFDPCRKSEPDAWMAARDEMDLHRFGEIDLPTTLVVEDTAKNAAAALRAGVGRVLLRSPAAASSIAREQELDSDLAQRLTVVPSLEDVDIC